jgi:hypothetical protein
VNTKGYSIKGIRLLNDVEIEFINNGGRSFYLQIRPDNVYESKRKRSNITHG